MPKITYIDVNGNERTCDVPSGISVMEGAIQNGIEGILAICGGSCACSTCHASSTEPALSTWYPSRISVNS